ncbi:MAG: FG-GAP-like repeat-containing protein, partial [Myxococcota bacterium]|nr:FG-GAP-like repeat-containing protein [Myxococcota bacterium]
MRLRFSVAGLVLGAILLLACGPPPVGSPEPVPDPTPAPDPEPDPVKPPTGFNWTAGPGCGEPTAGMDRFTEEGELRGLVVAGELGRRGRSTLLAEDLDADGDIDLVYSVPSAELAEHSTPMVLENDGSGFFSRPPIAALDVFQWPSPSTFLAADLDGNRLPELLLGAGSEVLVLENLGGMNFGSIRSLFDVGELMLSGADPAASGLAMKFTVGDADGDGDLDLAVLGGPPALPPPEQGGEEAGADAATPELLLLLEDGEVADSILLVPPSGGTLSLGGAFTDRDGDGDLDLLVTSDLKLPGSFWRNDGLDAEGLPIFVDDAAAVGAALEISAMGVDMADLNADGWLDYCITDTASPACLLSSGEGDWYEAGAALGLEPAVPVGAGGTLGWGFDLADLDNDGLLDAVQASGRAGNLGASEYDADYP